MLSNKIGVEEMDFLITNLINPIEKPIMLSEKLSLIIDNPRTEEEIELFRNNLEFSIENHSLNSDKRGYKISIGGEIPEEVHINPTVDLQIKHVVYGFDNNCEFTEEVANSYSKQDKFKFLAENWVIIRFDRNVPLHNEIEKRIEQRKILAESKNRMPDIWIDEPVVFFSDYINLLFMLFFDSNIPNLTWDSFYSLTFRNNYLSSKPDRVNNDFYNTILNLSSETSKYPTASRKTYLYKEIIEPIFSSARRLDNVINYSYDEKLFHVAQLLRLSSNEKTDIKIRLVLLASIIELLLTHNPNHSRFNVEDSISKQFQLKTAIVVYEADKSQNLEELKKNLRIIYDLRSKIAHGDLSEIVKIFINNTKGTDEESLYVFLQDKVWDLMQYVQYTLQKYVEDKGYIDFLKAS
jgi:hypothetical protein